MVEHDFQYLEYEELASTGYSRGAFELLVVVAQKEARNVKIHT